LLVIVTVGGLLAGAPPAQADETRNPITLFLDGVTVHGLIDAGGEPRSVDGQNGKFEEYRDIPDNAVINDIRLHGEHDERDYFADFRAEDAIQEDQRYRLRLGKYGKYEVDIEWDQVPHLLSTTGQSLFTEGPEGTFNLSDTIRGILASDPALLPSVLDGAYGVSLAARRDTGRFRFRYTPHPGWETRLGYEVQRVRGAQPLDTANFTSLSDGAPSPLLASIVELPSPVDALTHTVTSNVEYHTRAWFLSLGHVSSLFDEQVNTLVWDNPFQLVNEVGAGSQGRLTLAPNNQAHTLNLSGGANLPQRTRVTGTFAYGWMLQDDSFVPATINPTLAVAPLPRASYDGNIQTILADVRLSSRPHDAVTFNARYHYYDLDNQSPTVAFANYAIADAVVGAPRTSVPYAYSRQSAGADVVVRPLPLASMKTAFEYVLWHREHREVNNSQEYRVGPSLDLNPAKGLLLRAGYTHANRDPTEYNPYAVRETGSRAIVNPLLRKFDEAEVDRDQVTTLLSITRFPAVDFTGTFTYGADDYSESSFGLLDADRLTYSLQTAGTPHERLTLRGSYGYEDYTFHQGVGLGALGKAAFEGRGRDTVDTWGAGAQALLVPGTVDLDLDYSLSLAVGRLRASSSTESVTNFPNVNTHLQQFTARLNYKLTSRVTAQLGFAFERYTTNDFASQGMQPFMPSADGPKDALRPPSVYLGARNPDGDYNAYVGTVALRYQF
jgi:MtrB/PioB family decaheme-associated outer membrane protein